MHEHIVISIIIPVFNGEKYLADCLNSILSQSYKRFEIVIIDDGSTDLTEIIVKSYLQTNSQIQYFFQSNQGVSRARNKGIDLARGEFVMFIDADDYISPDYLNNFIKYISKDFDIIIGGITKVFENSVTQVKLSKEGLFTLNEILTDFAVEQKQNGIYGFVCSKLIRRSVIVEKKIKFDTALSLAEDFDFFLKYYQECKVFFIINEFGYFYRQNNKVYEVDFLQQVLLVQQLELFLMNRNFLNIDNKNIIYKTYSELKFAYFNELKEVSVANVRKGYHQLHAITWQKSKDHNRKMIKKLAEGGHFRLLTVYLLLRKQYINLRKEWS